jgi:hypothetical protein
MMEFILNYCMFILFVSDTSYDYWCIFSKRPVMDSAPDSCGSDDGGSVRCGVRVVTLCSHVAGSTSSGRRYISLKRW